MKSALLMVVLVLAGCGPLDAQVSTDAPDVTSAELRPFDENGLDTVDVGSWNVEWFGATDNGPTDEALQQANVARVIKETNLDLIGLVEVVSPAAFEGVMAKLPGYSGLLVTDPRVTGGASYYSANEQKVALVFRNRFTIDSARVVMTDAAYSFGGRPPMEVKLHFTEGGRLRSLVILVAHFKALANYDGYHRRIDSAVALESFLTTEYPTRWVMVVGDFNDDLDFSTYWGKPSPFASLVANPDFSFTTASLTASNTPTTVGFSSTIDHHLVTHTLAQRFVAGSAKVLRPDAFVTDYGTSTSDHYPVVTRYDLR